MSPYTERVIAVIRSVPEGTVMTYGQVARLAGSARSARQVVRILHSLSAKHQLPWHRIINAKGEIRNSDDESVELQHFLLRAEGVLPGPDGRISLEQYQYRPDEEGCK